MDGSAGVLLLAGRSGSRDGDSGPVGFGEDGEVAAEEIGELAKAAWLALMVVGAASADEAKLYLQLGHSGQVASARFSRDGRYVLTGGYDHTARLWETATGVELRKFEDDTDAVDSVAFSPDGRFVATASRDGIARLWDAATGREIRKFEGHADAVDAVVFSTDGRWLLTGSDDKTARLWDVTTGQQIRKFEGGLDPVNSVAFSPDGRLVLTGDGGITKGAGDNTARLWDVATGQQIRKFEGHSWPVESVAFSPDGRAVLTGSWDRTARLWDAATGREIRRFEGHKDTVFAVAFSPDGRYVATGSDDHTARLWDAATGQHLLTFSGHTDTILSTTFSPDGQFLLTGGWDGSARLWDVVTARELRRFVGQSSYITAADFSPDGHHFLTGGGDKAVHIWDVGVGQEVRRLVGHSDAVYAAKFSPDGRDVLTGSVDKTARVWDATTGAELRKLTGHSDVISAVVWSPDGRLALTGSEDKTARLWETASGRQLRDFGNRLELISSVAFSPDGRLVLAAASALNRRVPPAARAWDAATGREVRSFEQEKAVFCAAFSPDGRFVFTGGADNLGRLWDAASGQELRKFTGHTEPIYSVVFSRDGRFLLTGSADNTARLWDAATGRQVREFEGHTDAVRAAGFSPDGRFVLTGSGDHTAGLWDLATGQRLATLVSFIDGTWAVVDPDGRYDAADPDNASGLLFVAGYDAIKLGQLKQRFYTPGLLVRIWHGEKFQPLVGSLRDVKLVPGIEVDAPDVGSMLATVKLVNRGGGIGRVIVKVNGRELTAESRNAPPDVNAKMGEVKVDLSDASLAPSGKNVIEVFAENGDGVIRSRGVTTLWEQEAPKQMAAPRLFAIVAGTASFDDPRMNLRYPAKDATDFAHALELAADGLFGRERTHVSLLASDAANEPSKENIRHAFEEVAKNAQPSDLLVVYFAGHGAAAASEHDQYYYFTREARSAEVDRDAGLRAVTTISSAELREWLSRKGMPLKQVVVLDTCAAGAAFNDVVKLAERRELSPDQIRAIELLKDSTGSWILMGSAADAVSYEASRYAQGLLTYALLEGMQGQALDEGGQVEVGKLFGFAQRAVVDLAKGIGGIQQPVLSAPKGQTFPIGLLTPDARKEIHLATLKPQVLQARVHDPDDSDPLKLEPALRAALRAASMPITRGSDRTEPSIVYLDSVVDEVPEALVPRVVYEVASDVVKVRLRLLRNGTAVSDRNLEIKKAGAEEMVRVLLAVIVEESRR